MKRQNKKILLFLLMFALMIVFFPVLSVKAASTITINQKQITLYVGNKKKLKLSHASKNIKWSSSKPSIAKVNSSGIITAQKKGTTKITAKYQGKSYVCKVTVKSLKLSDKSITLREGQGYSLSFNKYSGKGKWSQTNASVARVNSNGFISPYSPGNSKVTVKVGNETYKCNVKVVKSFSENDFIFDEPDDEGYTNYIDYSTGKGSSWYWYFDTTKEKYKMNRGINIGDTLKKFTSAYGLCDFETVSSSDYYSKHFSTSAYPRKKTTLDYFDSAAQKHYYKTFYFDRTDSVVLIIWHR